MEKSDIEKLGELNEILKGIVKRFDSARYDFKNGKNQKIKSEGNRQMLNEMDLAKIWLERHQVAYKIASGGERELGVYRKEYFDDSFRESSFVNDMQIIIKKIDDLMNDEYREG